MKTKRIIDRFLKLTALGGLLLVIVSCDNTSGEVPSNGNSGNLHGNASIDSEVVFLLIDEESIDNGNEPNNFSETDVNDQLADIGLRRQLQYFRENLGEEIDLSTGQVGDEGWHAPASIPGSWISTGPTSNGLRNYLVPGPGLGGGDDGPEVLLDEIPNVIPLRATGLAMLEGQTVLAVVYDSDISINYDPIEANLQGANLGIVAFEVLEVTVRGEGSDGSLPRVRIRIQDADLLKEAELYLFANAPRPASSSEPEDTVPPATYPDIELVVAP